MKLTRNLKMPVDIAMTVLLLLQMGYHLWGERTHEWTGAALFLLFILHHLLNRGWYKSLFKGRYPPARVLLTAVDLLVFAAMAARLYSGITLSRYLFRALPLYRGMALARRLHILGAYWGYLFIGLHLGLHWGTVLKMAKKRFPALGRAHPLVFSAAGLLAAGCGLFVLLKRNLADNLFLRTEFVFLDYGESRLLFLLDYLALMALCVFVSYFLMKGLQRPERKKP